MGFFEAVQVVLGKYATFSGRARRAEFWWFALFGLVVGIVLSILDGIIFGYGDDGTPNGLISTLFSLAILLPSIGVAVRRLHDKDMSGWWYLLIFVPILGFLVLLYFFVQKGTDGDNRFGSDPLAGDG
ncbi:MAG: DUF805 domain-containing protein [Pseudomonadota bacterium]